MSLTHIGRTGTAAAADTLPSMTNFGFGAAVSSVPGILSLPVFFPEPGVSSCVFGFDSASGTMSLDFGLRVRVVALVRHGKPKGKASLPAPRATFRSQARRGSTRFLSSLVDQYSDRQSTELGYCARAATAEDGNAANNQH